jgi:SPP1 gp7 family putative phage head morphogenesis protein
MNLLQKFFAKMAGVSPQAFLRGDDVGGQVPGGMGEPYRQSVWVQSAIKKVARPIAAVSVEFYGQQTATKERKEHKKRRPDDEQLVEVPEMAAFLDEPMAGLGASDLVEALVGWLNLAGESFWILPDEMLLPYPRLTKPLQVIVARPDRMCHLLDAGRTKIVGWEFTDAAGRRWPLLPEQVIFRKYWNPYDPFRGLGPLEAALIAAQAAYQAGRFKLNLMANNGDTGPYIVAKNGIVDDGQREQLMEQLRAKRRAQLRGEFRPMLITGDIAVENPQVRSVDASYIAGVIEDRHEIYAAFGVPPSMADVKAAYSIGSASDYYTLITDTCMPTGGKYCEALEDVAKVLRTATKRPVRAHLNWDEHPVMQQVRKERLESVDKLWSKGMPLSDISEYLDLGLPEFKGWDVGYLPFGVVAMGEDLQSATMDPAMDAELGEDLQSATDDEKDEDTVAQAEKAVGAIRRALKGHRDGAGTRRRDARDTCGCGCSLAERDADPKRDAKEVAQWRAHMAKRRVTQRAFKAAFHRVLMAARREVLKAIEGKGLLLALSQDGEAKGADRNVRAPLGRAAAAADFIFDLGKFSEQLWASMRGVASDALQRAGEELYAEVGKDDPWQMPPAKALEFLNKRKRKIDDASAEVFEQIMGTLKEGIEQGEPMTDLARRVRAEFNAADEVRGLRIAMTETGAAYGDARQEAMESAGVEYKRWLTSGNSNVRAAHRAMNGTVVPLEEKFLVIDPKSGESDEVKHPGDEAGAPWNVINCHCVVVAEFKPQEGEAEEAGTAD